MALISTTQPTRTTLDVPPATIPPTSNTDETVRHSSPEADPQGRQALRIQTYLKVQGQLRRRADFTNASLFAPKIHYLQDFLFVERGKSSSRNPYRGAGWREIVSEADVEV
jgi:hypothetical protein